MKEWYAEERRLFSALKKAGFSPKIIFDVGSSHGGWSDVLAGVFDESRFYLFEPLFDLKAGYRENCERVLRERPNFELFKFALGATDGEIDLFSDEPGYSASILPDGFVGQLSERHRIPIRTLAGFVLERKISMPDILKMDVQGAELLVLQGAGERLCEVKAIQAEAWLERGYGPRTPLFHELSDYLKRFGFYLLEIGERFYSDRHCLYVFDSFFIHESIAGPIGEQLPVEALV